MWTLVPVKADAMKAINSYLIFTRKKIPKRNMMSSLLHIFKKNNKINCK